MTFYCAGAGNGSGAAPSSSLDPIAIVDRVLAGGSAEAGSASLEAQADLLAACLAHQADPAAACGAALLRLAGIEPEIAGASALSTSLGKCKLYVCQLWQFPGPAIHELCPGLQYNDTRSVNACHPVSLDGCR